MRMKWRLNKSLLEYAIVISEILCFSPHSAIAQLQSIANDTLGSERSRVTPSEINGIPGDLMLLPINPYSFS